LLFNLNKTHLIQVIYALNSKNDESENLIANLKAQFEEEKEQLVLDTNKKLEEYKNRINFNNDQAKKMNTLEAAIKEYQKQK
jgi:endonuclease III